MKLVVGLGNIGKEYDNTRHNVGFMALDNYLGNVSWKKDKLAYTYKDSVSNTLFIKPTTFMNLSGNAIRYYVDYYKINIDDILVIQDDLDLPLGKVRVKVNSSAGGHNGIKDIILHLGTNAFMRVKVGISSNSDDIVSYVLGKFSKDELNVVNESFNKVGSIIDSFINNEDVNIIMNRNN